MSLIGAILVFNTLSNLITQQTNQIGILKAIGGRTPHNCRDVSGQRLGVRPAGSCHCITAGRMVAHVVTKVFLNLFNIDFDQFQISRQAVILQAVCAHCGPAAGRIAARVERCQYYRAAGDCQLWAWECVTVPGWIDRLVEAIGQRWLPSHYATALGNMFRHKGRLILTQLVLIAAGSSFLMVMSLNSSLALTLDNFFARQRYDTTIQFEFATKSRSESLPWRQSVPKVWRRPRSGLSKQPACSWQVNWSKRPVSAQAYRGIPADSDFFKPLDRGRTLVLPPEDGRAIVHRTRDG